MTSPSPSSERIAARTLGVGLLLLLAALGLARGLGALVERGSPPERRHQFSEGTERLVNFLDALPGIAQRDDAVLVFGSSIIQHGFSPETFEQHVGAPVTAYNVGFPGVDPETQALLARRVASTFERSGHKARLALVEFTPFQATLARGKAVNFRELSAIKKALLADPLALARIARRSPEEASHIAALRLLGGTSPKVMKSLLEDQTLDRRQPDWWPVPETLEATLLERRDWVTRIHEGRLAAEHRLIPEWDPVHRGEVRWIFEGTRDAYLAWARLRSNPEDLKEDQEWRIKTSDILELRFDDAQLRYFIEAVKALSSVSRETRVVLAPRHPVWNQPTPEGRARLAAVLARIEQETGAQVLNLAESPEFASEDFIDVTHLNESSGRPKFSRRLAEAVAEQWGRGVAKDASP